MTQWLPSRERFEAKIDRSGGPDACHLWTAAKAGGYGRMGSSAQGVIRGAHQIAWQFAHGEPPPETPCVLHRCDNPACVNVAHLWLGTQADNMRDMREKGRSADLRTRGADNGNARLTEDQVREIRSADGSCTAIGKIYGVSKQQVRDIILRRKWASLP